MVLIDSFSLTTFMEIFSVRYTDFEISADCLALALGFFPNHRISGIRLILDKMIWRTNHMEAWWLRTSIRKKKPHLLG